MARKGYVAIVLIVGVLLSASVAWAAKQTVTFAVTDWHQPIEVWNSWFNGGVEQYSRAFDRPYASWREPQWKSADIEVKFVHIDTLDKFLVNVAGGVVPHLFQVDGPSMLAALVNLGAVTDLTPYIVRDKIDMNQFWPEIRKSVTFGNGIYAIPESIKSAWGLNFNKDIFDQYGVAYPTTKWNWHDLELAAVKLTHDTDGDGKKEVYGFDWPHWEWNQFIYANGGTLFDAKVSRSMLTSKPVVDAVKQMVKFGAELGVRPPSWAWENYWEARLAMLTCDAQTIFKNAYVMNPNMRIDATTAPSPTGLGGSLAAMYFVIPSALNDQQKEAAWQVMKALMSDKFYWDIVTHPGFGIPPTRSALQMAMQRQNEAFGRRGSRQVPSDINVVWEMAARTIYPSDLTQPVGKAVQDLTKEIRTLVESKRPQPVETLLADLSKRLDAALQEEPWNKKPGN